MRRRDETKSKVSGGGGSSCRLVVSWTGPDNVPKNGVQKFEKYGMDFGPPRYGRLVVSPSRLAVSSRRLVVLLRLLKKGNFGPNHYININFTLF